MPEQQKILIATKNPGKFSEILEILGNGVFELVFLGDLEIEDADFVEDGETFEENSLKKAAYYSAKTGLPAIGEDSGIIVEALEGELGIKTRRWGAGEFASDEEWIEYFLERMEAEQNRKAKFVCSSCLILQGEEPVFFRGETRGVIADKLLAPIRKGLPLSSCFVPDGFQKSYAQLSVDEKNKISHRGKALHSLKEYLFTRG